MPESEKFQPDLPKPSAEIQPALERDPTLTFFQRLSNPAIQEQMVSLLLENEEAQASEMPDYVKKLPGEVSREVQERIRAVTDIEGEKNVVYLHPKNRPKWKDAGYQPVDDEVQMNCGMPLPGGAKPSILQLSTSLAHEKGHQIRRYAHKPYLDDRFRNLIDWENLSMTQKELDAIKAIEPRMRGTTIDEIKEGLKESFEAGEILERMSQLKQYFGFTGNETFTKAHLDYARAHYLEDVFDNHMGIFFRSITPEKEDKFIEGMNTLGV